jgi:hypothetical protein
MPPRRALEKGTEAIIAQRRTSPASPTRRLNAHSSSRASIYAHRLSVRATLQFPYCCRDVATFECYRQPVALLGVFGARQGYRLCSFTMLSDEVPCGASNITVCRYE